MDRDRRAQPVRKAYYSVNGQEWIRVEPLSGLSDAASLQYALRLPEVLPRRDPWWRCVSWMSSKTRLWRASPFQR